MSAKDPSESMVLMTHMVLPEDTNPSGNTHGGVILKHIDTAAGIAAMRHCRGNAVTANIERMDFLLPVFVGELVTFKACVNSVGRSSMEVGVRVEAENLFTGEVRHTNSAYLTFVHLDEHGKPGQVPELLLDSERAIRRDREAKQRRKMREELRRAERRK